MRKAALAALVLVIRAILVSGAAAQAIGPEPLWWRIGFSYDDGNASVLTQEGTRILSVGKYGELQLRDARTLSLLGLTKINKGAKALVAVAASRDGGPLAVAEESGDIYLVDAATLVAFKRLGNGGRFIRRLEFSPDGALLLSDGISGGASGFDLWNLAGSYASRVSPSVGRLLWAGFCSGGSRIVACGDRGIEVYDAKGSARVAAAEEAVKGACSLSPDGSLLAYERVALEGPRKGGPEIAVRKTADASLLRALPGSRATAFDPEGKRLFSSDDSGSGLSSWDLATGERVLAVAEAGGGGGIALSPDGALLLRLYESGLRVYDAKDGRLLETGCSSSGFADIALSPDGRVLAACEAARVGSPVSSLHFLDGARGVAAAPLSRQPGRARGAEYSLDGKRLLIAREEGLFMYAAAELAGGTALASVLDAKKEFLRAKPSPDGQAAAVVVVKKDRQGLRLIDLATGKARDFEALAPGLRITDFAFAPDGSSLAACASNGTLRLWSARTGKLAWSAEVQQDKKELHALAISPDGSRLAAGGESFVAVYELAKGKQLAKANDGEWICRSLAFSKDGSFLAAALAGRKDSGASALALLSCADLGKISLLKCGFGVDDLSLSEDGRLLACRLDDGAAVFPITP